MLATSEDSARRNKAEKRFFELYWGELALVENPGVETAMVRFKDGLVSGASPDQLQQLSLKLAGALRASLADSWGVDLWRRSGVPKPE